MSGAAATAGTATSCPPVKRLELLCDEGSLQLVRSETRSRRMGIRARAGDGVIAGSGRVGGRPVLCFAQDATFAGGSLGEAHAETIVRLHELAARAKAPVVGFIDSAGARMQEGLAALGGYGRLFRQHVRLSGVVPQISVICGPSAGGGCYAPALTDFVILTERARMFLTGPSVVEQVTGERVSARELGGPRVHAANGVAHAVVADEEAAAAFVHRLLGYLPSSAAERPPRYVPVDPPPPSFTMPALDREVYDVRELARGLVDGGRLLEISPRFARNVVCAFAHVEGRAVGVVANQPHFLGGVLDAAASQKAARFVRTCNAFGVPILTLVDTPGFLPGVRQERDGVIRHGSKLVYAFAESRVPRVTVVLRKAYGGAAIAMNSKQLGADYVFAWPGAEIGVIGAQQAVEIIHRAEITAAPEPRAARSALAARYVQEHLTLDVAASEGFVDEVIAPEQTRGRVADALSVLDGVEGENRELGNIHL
ncbi:MAG TPA: carboxyl transferase domain-containing protein [Solirubrobacteraceae bacterium]|nr:carboxyl transferase domain-containing protein [Solirubrobacteraceae bacterium]